jgi:hypothetical protein
MLIIFLYTTATKYCLTNECNKLLSARSGFNPYQHWPEEVRPSRLSEGKPQELAYAPGPWQHN